MYFNKVFVKKITKNKCLELQLWNDSGNITNIINVNFTWSIRTDHAGFRFNFELLSFMFEFNIYDTRHWDNEKNCYYDYKDQ